MTNDEVVWPEPNPEPPTEVDLAIGAILDGTKDGLVGFEHEHNRMREADFRARYPHGVLLEQEGGVPNDALNWEDATHICRKHGRHERACVDAKPQDGGPDAGT